MGGQIPVPFQEAARVQRLLVRAHLVYGGFAVRLELSFRLAKLFLGTFYLYIAQLHGFPSSVSQPFRAYTASSSEV